MTDLWALSAVLARAGAIRPLGGVCRLLIRVEPHLGLQSCSTFMAAT